MKIRMSVEGLELTGELEKYASAKLRRLGKFVPRRLRAGAAVEVQFSLHKRKGAKYNTCGISFMLDGTKLKAEETTLHMYTALDVAAVHIEHQLKDYARNNLRRRLRTRLRRFFRR
ncbi:MAG TPA: ribosome-associated translation inhibitor RaiA [Candidatus Saccharimonadales bacterium]|nr:ribosome-associated translation inhibitor RaiA [Candidatus Saccharimonadales bacterium]